MIKRTIIFILTLILALSLAACGKLPDAPAGEHTAEKGSGIYGDDGAEIMSGGVIPLQNLVFASESISEIIINATTEPADASYKEVNWTAAFNDPSAPWAIGKKVSDYITVEPVSDGSLFARLRFADYFSERIIIKVSARRNPEIYATAEMNCIARVEYSVYEFRNNHYYDYAFTLGQGINHREEIFYDSAERPFYFPTSNEDPFPDFLFQEDGGNLYDNYFSVQQRYIVYTAGTLKPALEGTGFHIRLTGEIKARLNAAYPGMPIDTDYAFDGRLPIGKTFAKEFFGNDCFTNAAKKAAIFSALDYPAYAFEVYQRFNYPNGGIQDLFYLNMLMDISCFSVPLTGLGLNAVRVL